MEFPSDIWTRIIEFFHSSYRNPIHYNCILENDLFYYMRERHKKRALKTSRFTDKLEQNLYKINNSFYMTLILQNLNNTLTNKKNIQMKRKVARNNVLKDFDLIFKEYRNRNVQFLSNIKYL